MTKDQVITLFGYNDWANRRILECAARLADEQYFAEVGLAQGFGHASLHATLFHILRAAHGWRQGLQEGRQGEGLQPEQYPDLAAIRAGMEAESAAMQVYLGGLSDDQLAAPLQLIDRRGRVRDLLLWRVLVHLLYHGMQHRSEAAAMLTSFSQSPGDLDFIFYRG